MTPGSDSDAASTADEAEVAVNNAASPAEPEVWDTERWKAFFAALPLADLWRVLQKEKAAQAAIFAGFRVSKDALKQNPIIRNRLVEGAVKNPAFAKALREAKPPENEPAPAVVPVAPPLSAVSFAPKTRTEPDAKTGELQAQINVLREAAKQNTARSKELETMLKRAERDRDASKSETAMQIAARKAAEAAAKRAEAQAEREKRARARDQAAHEITLTKAQTEASQTVRPAKLPIAPTPLAPPPAEETLLYQAAERLLQSGRFSAVSDLCKEGLRIGPQTGEKGRIHFLYAQALYGAAETAGGETQARFAVSAFLESGNAFRAADALSLLLTNKALLRASDVQMLRRLNTLSEKTNQTEAVQTVLRRLRLSAPPAWNRLKAAVQNTPASALLGDMVSAAPSAVGPDETISLPGGMGEALNALTPRQVVRAVDSGDETTVLRARTALAALRQDKDAASLADLFLEAVSALSPVAVCPLEFARNRPVFVDASNVARYKADPLSLSDMPRVAYLRQMRDYLLRRGYFPVSLIADATLRFNVDDKAAYLDLIAHQIVRETPPGTSADETLISESLAKSADLITNDRLSEWGERVQNVERIGFLIAATGISLTPF